MLPEGKPISRLKHYGELSYLNDYMFIKNMRGDMMHIVKAEAITTPISQINLKTAKNGFSDAIYRSITIFMQYQLLAK